MSSLMSVTVPTPRLSDGTARHRHVETINAFMNCGLRDDALDGAVLADPLVYQDMMSMDVEAIRALFAEASLGGPDKAVGFVLWRVMHRYQRAVERALAPHELTHLQFTTLAMTAWM